MQQFRNIKNILFDFGGVIVNLKKSQAIARFKEIGFANIEDYLTEFRQSGIFLDYETGALNREEFLLKFRELGNNNATMEQIDYAWLGFLDGIPAYKLELIKALREKYKVFLLSNTNPSVAIWAHSEHFNDGKDTLSDYFDKSYLSFELGCAKPDPQIFELIIKDAGIKPEETLFFDDGKANIESAKNLGFQSYLTNQDEDLRLVFNNVNQ